jgi:hypothetical protein
MGLSVISLHALGEHYAADALAVLNVVGFPIHSNWYSVTLLGKRLSPPAVAFLAYLAAHASEVEPGKKVASKPLPRTRVQRNQGGTTDH